MNDLKDNLMNIVLEGMPSNEGHVELSDLSLFITSFKSLLDKLDYKETGTKSNKYRIIKASHNSPLEFAIESDFGNTFEAFNNLVEDVRNNNANKKDYPILKDYFGLIKKFNNKFTKMSFKNTRADLDISNEDVKKAKTLIETNSHSFGSVTGRIEKLNIHGNNRNITIYPLIGNAIECKIPDDLINAVVGYVGRRVMLTGTIGYTAFSDFPVKIKAVEVDCLPEDNELPSVDDICGIYPDLTGDLTTEEYIKKQREGYISE